MCAVLERSKKKISFVRVEKKNNLPDATESSMKTAVVLVADELVMFSTEPILQAPWASSNSKAEQ